MVALDKKTGELIWKCAMPPIGREGKDSAGYTTIVPADIEGVRQYLPIVGRALSGGGRDGPLPLGLQPHRQPRGQHPSPIARGNMVFVTTSYKTACPASHFAKWRGLERRGGLFLGPKDFENHHGGVVLVGDHVYGGDGQNKGVPVCLEFETGKVCWKPELATARPRSSTPMAT